MSTLNRRTFLVGGAQASAAVVTASALTRRWEAAEGAHSDEAATLTASSSAAGRLLGARALTVNGVVDPVGVDPDDCNFAWTLGSVGRGARQRGYRIVVRRTDPGHRGVAWDSGRVGSSRQAFVLYGGPALAGGASYSWRVSVEDADGSWGAASAPATFVTMLRDSDWRARWLHPHADSDQPDQVTYLRSVFTVPPGTLSRAVAYTAAAHTYRLFVNGTQVDFGPSFCFPDEQYVRAADVTGHFRGGAATCIGVLHRWYGGGKGRPVSAPGLLAEVVLTYEDGRTVSHGTDATWKERPAEWLPSPLRNTEGYDFVEWVDARAHPAGWATPDYDDGDWAPVSVRGPVGTAPFTTLYAQRTHVLEHVVTPVSSATLPGGARVFDFGKVYPARLRIRFEHGIDGHTVPMHVGYLLDPDGAVSTTHGTQTTNLSFSYIQRAGSQVFEALTYEGFRYLQIDQAGEFIGRDQVEAVAQHAVMPDVPMATFASGDHVLDAVWKLNARSSLYCTHEQFVDTPTREKGQFVWDAANESEVVMMVYGDRNMSWQGLRDMARSQARYWPDGQINEVYPNGNGAHSYPTFTERYAEWVWRYYLATGDRDTAVLLYPSLIGVATFLWGGRSSTTGLLTGFSDPDDGDPVYGYDLSVAADTASNVIGVNAFRRIAQVAHLAGDSSGAALQQARAVALETAINARLVRADGVYVDGVKPDGSQSTHASQEANALALAYGVVPGDRVAAVASYVVGLGISLGPQHGLELMRGLASAGLPQDMVRLLTDRSIPGWAHVLAAGGTFMWEVWQPSDLIGDSMSHGWGSSALVAMQESLLGLMLVEPDADGTVVASVRPPLGSGLSGVRGSICSVAGPVAAQWRDRGPRLTVDVSVPANARALVAVPATEAGAVLEGGMPVSMARGVAVQAVSGGRVELAIGSGTYSFSAPSSPSV